MTQARHVDWHGLTDTGQVRGNNQDQFLIADLNKSILIHQTSLMIDDGSRWFGGPRNSLMLVADGMGGHAAGERASTIAVDKVILYILNTMPCFFRLEQQAEEELKDELTYALHKCHESIRAEGAASPMRMGMGTTLTMAYTLWPRFYVVHVGDSRCYVLRRSSLKQITTDHTLAQEMVDRGALKPDQADESPLSSVLWNTLGGESNELTTDVYKGELQPGDTMLLCTDGLTGHVTDVEITEILGKAKSAEEACKILVNAANEAGGSDNITVVVARYRETGPQTATDFSAGVEKKDAQQGALQAPEQAAPEQVEIEASKA
jgi:protein phosphatase